MKPLDPKEDIVFKLLMVRNPELLRQMLEAVLHVKVADFRIRNPELPGSLRTDKHVALDVRVETTDGPRFDVEMQTYSDRALKQRMLFYWARLYGGQLTKGDSYEKLKPTYSVIWTVPMLVPEVEELHSTFMLRDATGRSVFSDHMQLHLLQLANLHRALHDQREPEVVHWARFLTAQTEEERDALAEENKTMDDARRALRELSRDEEALFAAQDRVLAEMAHRQAIEDAEVSGLQRALRGLLTNRFGELPPWVEERLQSATADQLTGMIAVGGTAPTLEAILTGMGAPTSELDGEG